MTLWREATTLYPFPHNQFDECVTLLRKNILITWSLQISCFMFVSKNCKSGKDEKINSLFYVLALITDDYRQLHSRFSICKEELINSVTVISNNALHVNTTVNYPATVFMRREFVQFQLPLVCLLVPNQLQKNTKLRRGNTEFIRS